MNFKEKSHEFFAYQYLGFSTVTFIINDEIEINDREIIHEFINCKQDFETARKYIGGYDCGHTNIKGETKMFKMYDFGPYPIDLLELEDYKNSTIEKFEKEFEKMLADFGEESKHEIKFIEFASKAKDIFKEYKELEFYQLLPDDWKFNEISAFELSDYLCGFLIDKIEKTITIIQIAVD